MIGWKTSNPGLPLNGKASSPAKMPTFSARLSKSHFPGPNIGIVFGLFLSLFYLPNLKPFIPQCENKISFRLLLRKINALMLRRSE
jgi:hypothetical protein